MMTMTDDGVLYLGFDLVPRPTLHDCVSMRLMVEGLGRSRNSLASVMKRGDALASDMNAFANAMIDDMADCYVLLKASSGSPRLAVQAAVAAERS